MYITEYYSVYLNILSIFEYIQYNWIFLFFLIKKLNFAVCNNMDGPGGYYAYWWQKKTNTVSFHLYVESEKLNKQI